MYSKQRSRQRCQCHPPHTSAGSPTAHQNHHNRKTGPDATSLIAAKEASTGGGEGPPWWSLEPAAPHLPKWGRGAGRGSTALVPCLSSSCCQANFSAAGTNYFPGTNPPGKLFAPGQLAATTDLLQTAGLLPPRLARGTITLGIRPYFPCAW